MSHVKTGPGTTISDLHVDKTLSHAPSEILSTVISRWRGRSWVGLLLFYKVAIHSDLGLHQLLMRSVFYDVSICNDGNHIGVADRTQSVCDDDRGTPVLL